MRSVPFCGRRPHRGGTGIRRRQRDAGTGHVTSRPAPPQPGLSSPLGGLPSLGWGEKSAVWVAGVEPAQPAKPLVGEPPCAEDLERWPLFGPADRFLHLED